ncbi:hypothetical protein A3J13_01620 [Candidatus Daviesbacteria bacterium RIFCSPLOWO2_02_FULL_36_8]|uniref:Uncharacterized protein n=1 Tax=Candidatus Daviesbacteria bacterium RIFCSPLOWO2_02_FULL_36_8 TaxID=1797793 RepID=A0A1F5MGZ7_9BACT|nr:MAG: hypothetical protein A3J13_01620 [Candidatus Daviesbacteria bacterium RIFCSPLOWO2_02_FULL_36_8]
MIRPEIRKAALSQISQEHWVHAKLMKRARKIPLRIRPIPVRPGEEDLGEKFIRRLVIDSGLIVLQEYLFPIFASTNQDPHKALTEYVERARDRVNQPIHVASEMGVGINIGSLGLTPYEAVVYYVLKTHPGQRLSGMDIAKEMHDKVGENTPRSVRLHVRSLRKKSVHGMTFRISTKGSYENKGYEYQSLI